MAFMFSAGGRAMRVLDPGAGVGALSAAFLEAQLADLEPPSRIELVAYEIDDGLVPSLEATLQACERAAAASGVSFHWAIRNSDFVAEAVELLREDLFHRGESSFDRVILNPPYRKLHTRSRHRALLGEVGIEVSNLYAAFVALSAELLVDEGELVAITPRSFCNGTYFTRFRRRLLAICSLERLHVFDSRGDAFAEDDVLQENVILKARKKRDQSKRVEVTASQGRADDLRARSVPFEKVVHPKDTRRYIHIPSERDRELAALSLSALPCSLDDVPLEVSTGRAVDFRAKEYLRYQSDGDCVPLIYPACLREGQVQWPPGRGKKPVALVASEPTEKLLVPRGFYVLVKRFTSKEEKRRLVAAVLDPETLSTRAYAIENHVNFFHDRGAGLDRDLAVGLAAFLNSTVMDQCFRVFSGHTQVNATDLRAMRYPRAETLRRLGRQLEREFPGQGAIDRLVGQEISFLEGEDKMTDARETRVTEALDALRQLGLPRAQQNDRSALALLALLARTPEKAWRAAGAPLMGVTPIMEFSAREYGRHYAPNTRETFRRFTLHQFVSAGLAVPNPDRPDRPVNSPKYRYQIEGRALEVLRAYGSDGWEAERDRYLSEVGSLRDRYAQARDMGRIPLRIRGTEGISLSPGGQSELVLKILDEFCPRFTPDAIPIYVGDTGDKWAYFDRQRLEDLDVEVDAHGKMPDVVVYAPELEWLVLIEAVTSHGPMNPKRHEELSALFADCKAGLVFVTAFLTRRDLGRYLNDIAWETEVWVAESPTHLIHFDGVRFLGPYAEREAHS